MNNFNRAFQQGHEVIERNDFLNRNTTMHNNLANVLINEEVSEYNIYIDSNDRDINTFNNPYKFTVSLGGVGASTTSKTVRRIVNGQQIEEIEKSTVPGTPGPIIPRKFENIKYVKVMNLILPRTVTLSYSQSFGYSLSNDSTFNLTENRFLILKINELSSTKTLATNNIISSDSIIMYREKILGPDSMLWLPVNDTYLYKNSSLKNLTRLTIELYTDSGVLLTVMNDTGDILNPKTLSQDPNNITVLNKLNWLCSLKFGILENDLNTYPTYKP